MALSFLKRISLLIMLNAFYMSVNVIPVNWPSSELSKILSVKNIIGIGYLND